jgi:Alpha-kinase family
LQAKTIIRCISLYTFEPRLVPATSSDPFTPHHSKAPPFFTDRMYAARTNLTSNDVRIHSEVIGEGTFRTCLAGTFVGGTRNGQAAACKRFKREYRHLEDEYFSQDFQIADKVIMIATDWNSFCDDGEEILVSKGSIHCSSSGIKYLVEPLIRDYERFTSNSGWIGDTDDWTVRCMEAFTHYSYERTEQQMIVCDLDVTETRTTFVSNFLIQPFAHTIAAMGPQILESTALTPSSPIMCATNSASHIGPNHGVEQHNGFQCAVVQPLCHRASGRPCFSGRNGRP